MELRHLRYFIAVAEELSFTRGAERLGINQPPLSQQIRQLEEELGTLLFRRQTRGVELTDAGKLFLEEARAILNQVEHARIGVARRARGETGRIKIGASSGAYLHPLIPTIIREFSQQFPDVELAPEAGSSALLTARVRAGVTDIAFLRSPVTDDDDLRLDRMFVEDSVLLLPTGHPLSGAESAPLSALAGEPLVLFPRAQNPRLYETALAVCQANGFSPTFGPEAPYFESFIALVACGLGWAIVPRSFANIQANGVFHLPIEPDSPKTEIWMISRRGDRSRIVGNFVRIALAERDACEETDAPAPVSMSG